MRWIVYSLQLDYVSPKLHQSSSPCVFYPRKSGLTKRNYDNASLNPPGGDVSDNGDYGKQTKFLNSKNFPKSWTLTSTLNSETVTQVNWKIEMFHRTSQVQADVICLHEWEKHVSKQKR